MRNIRIAILLVGFLAAASASSLKAQQQSNPAQTPDCPMMKKHEMVEMNERGQRGMGFSQDRTTHNFTLTKDGGIIQVEANDPKDTVSRAQIRQHLEHITVMFKEGNFQIPMFVHDQTPPGVPEMQRLKSAITYRFQETAQGGRVNISSADPHAVAAVHSFLRFQATEHKINLLKRPGTSVLASSLRVLTMKRLAAL